MCVWMPFMLQCSTNRLNIVMYYTQHNLQIIHHTQVSVISPSATAITCSNFPSASSFLRKLVSHILHMPLPLTTTVCMCLSECSSGMRTYHFPVSLHPTEQITVISSYQYSLPKTAFESVPLASQSIPKTPWFDLLFSTYQY